MTQGVVATLVLVGLAGSPVQAATVSDRESWSRTMRRVARIPKTAARPKTAPRTRPSWERKRALTPDQGATPENDTQKVEQPARRNPTTSGAASDDKE